MNKLALTPTQAVPTPRLALLGLLVGFVVAGLPQATLAVEATPIPAVPSARPWEGDERDAGRSAVSLLSDTDYRARPWIDSEFFLSQSQMSEFRKAYESSVDSYEYRRNYGLLGKGAAEQRQNEIESLKHRLIETARNKRWLEERDRAFGRIGIDKIARKVPVIVGAIALTHSFYFGERHNALDWRLIPELHIWAWHNAERSVGELVVNTPVVNTTVEYQGAALVKRTVDPSARDELLQFGLAKDLPVLHLSTNLKYGLLNRSLTASLSRPILPFLTGSVSAARQLDASQPYDPSLNSESARLDFQIHF